MAEQPKQHKTHPVFWVLGAIILTLAVWAEFDQKGKPQDTSTAAAPTAQLPSPPVVQPVVAEESSPKMKPETLVKFPKSSIACLTKKALGEVTGHLVKGENTKAKAYFIDHGGPCLMLSTSKIFKILAVEYNSPDMPNLGIMEVIGPESESTNGAWVFTVGAVVQ